MSDVLPLTRKAEECFDWLARQFGSARPPNAAEVTVLIASTFAITNEAATEYLDYWRRRSANYNADIGPLRHSVRCCQFSVDLTWRRELWRLLPSLMGDVAKEECERRKQELAATYDPGLVKLTRSILHLTHRADVCCYACYGDRTAKKQAA